MAVADDERGGAQQGDHHAARLALEVRVRRDQEQGGGADGAVGVGGDKLEDQEDRQVADRDQRAEQARGLAPRRRPGSATAHGRPSPPMTAAPLPP